MEMRQIFKAAVVAGIIFHIMILVHLFTGFLAPLSHDMTLFREIRGVDFNAVYMAGYYIRSGESLYRVPTQDEGIPHTRFRYPPPAAWIVGLPASLIPKRHYALGGIMWAVLLECLLILNINLSIRHAGKGAPPVVLAAFWLLFFPFAVEMHMGQFSFLAGCFIFWSALALRRERPGLAVLLWIPAVLLKIYPFLLVPVYVRRAGWRRTVGSIGLMAALALPHFLWRAGDLREFLALNLGSAANFPEAAYAGNQGFAHLLIQLKSILPGMTPPIAAGLVLGLGCILTLAYIYCAVHTTVMDDGLYIALGTALFFVLSREVWEHHYCLFLPPAAYYLLTRRSGSHIFAAGWMLIAAPTLYFFFNPSGLPVNDGKLPLNSAAGALYFLMKPLGIMLLLGLFFSNVPANSKTGKADGS